MILREQFEAWVIQYPRNRSSARVRSYPSVVGSVSEVYADTSVELAWQAYQAGHAASGRDELLGELDWFVGMARYHGWPESDLSEAVALVKKARGEA
jgi:hypothetical protein